MTRKEHVMKYGGKFNIANGETWTKPQPNRFFSSPCSPMMIKRVGRCFAAVYNPIPLYFTRDTDKDDRSPLIIRFSEDGGKTFSEKRAWILDDRGHCCYPDIFDGGNYCLIGYQALSDGVIRKISDWEFDRDWSPFSGT